MSNKSFGIYGSEEFVVEANDQLIIEIAKSHIAIVVSKQSVKSIAAYEMFNYNEDEAEDVTSLFNKISAQSNILGKQPSTASIYFNNEFCLPVPIFKFNKEIAVDYLNLVFGDDALSKIHFEHLPIEPGIMNVFRVSEQWQFVLNQHFLKHTIHHTYSNILQNLIKKNSEIANGLINIQFYNTSIVVSVLKAGNLQLIQTFVYDTPDDVLYHLLNITRQFDLNNAALTVQISGMIDLEFKLYRELITYFTNVVVENVSTKNLLLNVTEYPLHYFTPFFNLTL